METANEEAAVVGEEITSSYVRCAGTELYVSLFFFFPLRYKVSWQFWLT